MTSATPITLAVGIAGNVTGILLYASPLPIFVRIVKRRSTEAFSGVTYAFSSLSTLQWTYFALLRGPHARPLASLTAIGFSFQFAFNCIYLRFASKSQRILQMVLLIIAGSFFACMVTLTMLLLKGHVRATAVGIICTINAGFFSASPLIILRRVIKSGSTEFLPFYLPLFFLVSGVIWSVFAWLTGDIFIAIPNCVNVLLGGLQLVIHAYYSIKGMWGAPTSPLIDSRSEGDTNDGNSTSESDGAASDLAKLASSSTTTSDHDDTPRLTYIKEDQLSQITCTPL